MIVEKLSGRKFKSGNKQQEVDKTIPSPFKEGDMVYTFFADDSMVSTKACRIVKE